ncbi:hypothetical protein E4T56_gene10761 [Termitomyces sp. T112]|nr:hypothetical protein E4T56_gene10761 [Termitomyces sp. T112]
MSTLSADITLQVTNGQTHGPFTLPPLLGFHTLPIGAVTCKCSTKVQWIHHLSWPNSSSMNNGIANSEALITYKIIDQAIHNLAALEPGSQMPKLNLESAFHHIPVCQEDWPLLGFEWLRQFYYDIISVFGGRLALYIFNLFAEALHWILQHNIPAYIQHFLDDFLSIFPPSLSCDLVNTFLKWAMQLGSQLGLIFQPSKVIGPTTCLRFLGLKLDSISMEAYLSTVQSLHIEVSLPFHATESLLVQHIICSIKQYYSKRDRKPVQPITLPILTALLAQLQPNTITGHTTIQLACCLTYSTLLRSGKFMVGKGGRHSASLNLSQNSMQFLPNFDNATHVCLTLPASKTDPFCKGVTINPPALSQP